MPRLLTRPSNIAACLPLILIVSLTAAAQSAEHFSQGGVSFDYPDGWILNDRSRPESQQLILSRPDISSLVIVVALREPILTRTQLYAASAQVTEPYVRDLVAKLSSDTSPAKRDSSCEKIGEATIGGVRVKGEMSGAPTTAEVYAFPKGRRFLNVIYVRKNAEEPESAAAWKLVRESLKVDVLGNPQVADPEIDLPGAGIYAGGALNGKAVSLPRPDFPSNSGPGTVIVFVTVDETGKVIAVNAVTGPIPLRSASEQAARKARFTPWTLCGKPVKVNGSIVYNFVRQ